MRIARVMFADGPATAVDVDDQWVRLSSLGVDAADAGEALARPVEVRRARENLDPASIPPRDAVAADDATLTVPLTRSRKVLAIGLNYHDHVREVGAETPELPLLFGKLPNTLAGPYDDVVVDGRLTAQADYEVELAAVIGSVVRDVSLDDALDAVGGYAVANDLSSRDIQFAESQWIRSKSFDGFCPIGPWVTTRDEVPDPQKLDLSTAVNGETRQSSNTSEMVFGVAELVAFLSRGITLEPGDVILTGTPPGVALGMPGTPWLRPGDTVRCEIEGLGFIENTMTAPGT